MPESRPDRVAEPGQPPHADPSGLLTHLDGRTRCDWCGQDPDYVAYHDQEWGVPVHDDVRLFEKLCLEGFQAGLSWLTILRKREAFREVFAGFDPESVASYGEAEVTRLLTDPRIVRNRAKIEATIANARAYLDLVQDGGSLDDLVWSFVEPDAPVPRSRAQVRATSPASRALARHLKRIGFRFVGPTTVYAFMQAMGLVDDHIAGCHRRGAAPA